MAGGGRKKGESFRMTHFSGSLFGINWFVLLIGTSALWYWLTRDKDPPPQK